MMTTASGKVQTVLGCISPSAVGRCHTHEHLSMTFEVSYHPALPQDKDKANIPFNMPNLSWIQQYPYSHKPNLFLNEEQEAVLEEIKYFKENGGGTIVDNTTIGIDRDILYLKRVAEETGVNVVAGAGFYVGAAHPDYVNTTSHEDLYNQIVKEVSQGCDGTDIKCGVIGEIGCSWPLQDNEKKVLKAAGAAQNSLGCPLIIHPGRDETAPTEIVRILAEAGADIKKTVMSHLDRTFHHFDALSEFAKEGSYLEYDLFGLEKALYQPNPKVYLPNDGLRIQYIQHLLNEGYSDRLLLAHDIHTKHRLMKYGGHGYSHILRVVVPMMLDAGISQDTIDQMLIANPKQWLTFK